MEKKKIEMEMFVEKCKKCGKEVKGYTEAQVRSRMRLHLTTHKNN